MTEPQPVERAPVVLVCDDRPRGEQLLRAIGHPSAPIFGTETVAGWEDTPADVVVIWQFEPRLVPTRRRLGLVPEGTRAIVVVPSDRRGIIELVLREGATVLTWPGTDPRLAEELKTCLEEDDDEDEAVTVASDDLARELGAELSRRLQVHAPRLHLADAQQLETLVDRLATQVLEQARAITDVPIDDLDFDDLPTTIRPERRLPPPPDLDSLEETRPYDPVSSKQAELISHVQSLADDEDIPVAAVSSIPPPLPSTRRPRPMPAPEPLDAWVPYAGLVAAAALLALAGGVAYNALRAGDPDAVVHTPRAATAPSAYVQLGTPTVTPVEVPVDAAPEVAPEPEVSEADPPPAAPQAEPEPAPEPTVERAFRSAIRARAHRRFGRPERGLDAARFAARLDPENEEYRSLVEELRSEVETSMASMDPIEPAATTTIAADLDAAPEPAPEASDDEPTELAEEPSIDDAVEAPVTEREESATLVR